MTKIKTYFRCHKSKSDEGYIWISFYLEKEKVNFTTKVRCNRKHWIESKERVSDKDPFASDKNLIINKVLSRVNDVFVKYRLKNRELTAAGFYRSFNRPDDFENFFVFAEEYKKKFAVRNEESTMRSHSSVIKKLKDFRPDLRLEEITTEFLDEYFAYLTKKLGNNQNTAYKNMGTLKKYVRAAWMAGYIDSMPFKNWSIKESQASFSYLSEEELEILFSLYREHFFEDKLHQTLEVFIFMCLSSLHIGDLRALQIEQFAPTTFTYFRLKLRNSKPRPVVVPVSTSLRSLFDRIIAGRQSGPVFTKLPCDQTMNRYLKNISDMAEINKTITHKTGRHTFATYYLKKTKDIASLKEILGHSELKETLIYAHVVDESKQQGITCFNSFVV